MIIDEFINLNPSSFSPYRNDGGNINLLISSSVVVVNNISQSIPPFHLKAFTVPFKSSTGQDIYTALNEVEEFKFLYAGSIHTATIIDRQKKNSHYYIRFEDIIINTTASADDAGIPREELSEVVMTPYITENFINNDYNPRLGNSDALKTNSVAKVVDRNTNQLVPSNIDAIISGSAQAANIQDSSYTVAGLVYARYDGTKLNSGSVFGDDPALGLRTFKASLHPVDSDITTIKSIQLSDREVIDVRFNSKTVKEGSIFKVQNFPTGSNILFTEDGSRIIRLPNTKVYSVDKDEVYTSDENGIISSVE